MANNFVVKNLDEMKKVNELIHDESNNHINFIFLLMNIFHFFQNLL